MDASNKGTCVLLPQPHQSYTGRNNKTLITLLSGPAGNVSLMSSVTVVESVSLLRWPHFSQMYSSSLRRVLPAAPSPCDLQGRAPRPLRALVLNSLY